MYRLARDLWRVVEPYYQMASRSPEAVAEYNKIGLVRSDHQYFGGRLAPLGPVDCNVAVAVLYGFAPEYVGRAVPGLWSVGRPAVVFAARLAGVDATCRRVLADDLGTETMVEAAELGRALVDSLDLAGRPLAAGYTQLDWPDEPALALWQACTILREHRGDGHWAATSAEDLDAVECHVLHAAHGAMPADLLQRVSGWDDEAWGAAARRLVGRGLVVGGAEGFTITDSGQAAKLRVETATDRSSFRPLVAAGLDRADRLRRLMRPWVDRIMAAGVVGPWKEREKRWRDLPEPM